MKTRIFFLLALWLLLYTSSAQTGDLCPNAYPISLDDPIASPCTFKQISSLDFNDYNSNTGVPNAGCGYGATNYDFWIKVTLPANSDGLKITIDSTITSDNDYRNFIAATYTGPDCSSLSYHTCKTTSRKTVYNNFFDGFNPGETVYVRVYRKNSSSGTWDLPFFIRLTAINTTHSEDACGNARSLIPGTYCNYTSTDKNEDDNDAPDKLTGTNMICQPGTQAFGSFDNNQWYYFEVTPTTPQPVQIIINNVQCSAGDQILQAAIWKTSAYNCGNWANGYEMGNPANANDGDLLACAVGAGTVDITKNLPSGKYWYTIDGSAGAFCKYDILTNLDPPLPLQFLHFETGENSLHWTCLDDQEVQFYIAQSSYDGISFSNIDTLTAHRSKSISSYHYESVLHASYYRIAAIKDNLEMVFSEIRIRKESALENAVRTIVSDDGTFLIKITATKYPIRYSLHEVTGKEITAGKIDVENTITFEPFVSSGIMLLRIENGKEATFKKIVSSK